MALKEAMQIKKKITSNTTIVEETKNERPPKGAKIIESSVRTETEEIKNGWLVTKCHSGRYTEKDSNDSYGRYYSYTEKWYSKEDPLDITLNDKSLAEAFPDEE